MHHCPATRFETDPVENIAANFEEVDRILTFEESHTHASNSRHRQRCPYPTLIDKIAAVSHINSHMAGRLRDVGKCPYAR